VGCRLRLPGEWIRVERADRMCGGVWVAGSRIGLRNPGLTGVGNSTESRRNHDLSIVSARIAGVKMGG